jgi:hypothetical protein
MTNAAQSEQMKKGNGFIAALDQSGGSTPKALKLYGVAETEYSGETEMYDLIHKMRARIIKSPAFTGEKVIGAILVGALLLIPAAAARLVSHSLKGFFCVSVAIATLATQAGILLPVQFDLPVPSGAAIILAAGICFLLAALARSVVPAFKGGVA